MPINGLFGKMSTTMSVGSGQGNPMDNKKFVTKKTPTILNRVDKTTKAEVHSIFLYLSLFHYLAK